MSDEPFAVLTDVARAVDLHEGEAGVLRVLRALAGADGERLPTNVVARTARLPVPLAAAVLNELRERDLVDEQRPAGLTEQGSEAVRRLALTPVAAPTLEELADVVADLDRLVTEGPSVDVTLDQSFATAETKVRRVLELIATGALPTPSLLAIGDDDLVSVAIDKVQRHLGVRLVAELTVVDVSEPVLEAIAQETEGSESRIVLVRHDLREPLPARVAGRATVAMTDPPYTTQGATLFLTRALEGLRPGPGWDLFLHYGAKPPGPALELQRAITGLGLVVRSAQPSFSSYHGAGVIGGSSDAYRLEVATADRPRAAAQAGPIYTADLRNRPRRYRCAGCGHEELVGRGQGFATVADLKVAGCPRCGTTTFAPGQLAPATSTGTSAAAATGSGFTLEPGAATEPAPGAPPGSGAPAPDIAIRRATEADLPALAAYEIEIAKVSFGDDALTDPERHKGRLAKALERDPDGCLVSTRGSDGAVTGWLWMTINENFLTKEQYATFRSLAVSPGEHSTPTARALMEAGLDYARRHHVTEVTGKVNAANVPMRMLYRDFDFETQHLTMRLVLS